MQIMFLSAMITMICNPGAAVLYGYEKQGFIYKLGFVMAVINIIVDLIFIRPFGALGAAYCYAGVTVIGSSIGTIYTCRTMKLSYPFVSLFKILFASVIMGTVMAIIILHNAELFSFIFALVAGAFVYLISALVLGTFEQEDYTLMQSLTRAFPDRYHGPLQALINFVSQFKPGRQQI
jgi:O-antigen/teichoic acid export membrane protein